MVRREDLIEQHLYLPTSHDGYGSITAAFTPIRIACATTLNAAINGRSHSVKIRSSATDKARLETPHQLLCITNQLSTRLEALFNHWNKVKITDRAVKKLIRLAPAPSNETLSHLHPVSGKAGLPAFQTGAMLLLTTP